jgi:hypothetical protein
MKKFLPLYIILPLFVQAQFSGEYYGLYLGTNTALNSNVGLASVNSQTSVATFMTAFPNTKIYAYGDHTVDAVHGNYFLVTGDSINMYLLNFDGTNYTFVDPDTGAVKLRDLYAADDCGVVINPMIVEGQVHGGLARHPLAPLEDDEIGKWMRSLDTADRGEHAQRVLSNASPLWNAMLRDTIAPTILAAGMANNVIPGEAHANLNVRLLPGDTIEKVVGDLTKLVDDPLVKLEVKPNGGLAAPPSSLESDFYAVISKVAAQEFPGAAVLPFQSTWATDSSQLRLHNVQAYGLVPFPLTEEDLKRMHGDDERIPLAAFNKGVDVLARIVAEFAVTR